MDKQFTAKVERLRIARIESGGVFTHGDPNPTELEISVVNTQGDLQVLVFEADALNHLSCVIRSLMEAFPNAFGPTSVKRPCKD